MALAERMDAIERRVGAVEAEQAQIRAEWRVVEQAPLINGRLLRSLRETQIEHGRRLDEHGGRLDAHDHRFDEHDRRFDEHDRRFNDVDRQLGELREGMVTIVGMLTTLIGRDEEDR